jgi:hypothetical protein
MTRRRKCQHTDEERGPNAHKGCRECNRQNCRERYARTRDQQLAARRAERAETRAQDTKRREEFLSEVREQARDAGVIEGAAVVMRLAAEALRERERLYGRMSADQAMRALNNIQTLWSCAMKKSA